MANKHGSLSIDSDNLFPIIKKWLYSDHDIFYRELISNGCDAITKLKKLDMMGEYTLPADFKAKISVTVDPEAKTLTFTDNGLGMTADEVEEYICQIAFSGATDFIQKYKDKSTDDQIIGHFGLGFYSAFMVADEVEIDTLSYKEGATPVHWTCDGGTDYELTDGTKTTIGTQITLHLNEDCLEFANEYRAREVIEKYCSFMPTEIYLSKANAEPEYETIDAADKRDTDTVVEEIHEEAKTEEKENENGEKETVEISPAKDKLKILKRPVPLNDTNPLWPEPELVHRRGIQGVLPQGILRLQGAAVLDSLEYGLSVQLKGYPLLPEDQYRVRFHRGNHQIIQQPGIYRRQYQGSHSGISDALKGCDRLSGSSAQCLPLRSAE